MRVFMNNVLYVIWSYYTSNVFEDVLFYISWCTQVICLEFISNVMKYLQNRDDYTDWLFLIYWIRDSYPIWNVVISVIAWCKCWCTYGVIVRYGNSFFFVTFILKNTTTAYCSVVLQWSLKDYNVILSCH